MASTLTCFFDDPELHRHFHDPDIGGNVKKCKRKDEHGPCDVTAFLRIPPMQRGGPKDIRNSIATLTTMPAGSAEISKQETVFVKWSFDESQYEALRREADVYKNSLKHLQGTVVPTFLGRYKSTNSKEYFSISIFEYCAGSLPDNAEYHRQYMVAACKIHAANVDHGQLADKYSEPVCSNDRHVIFDRLGRPRIVDFTRASKHVCHGAPLDVPGVVYAVGQCKELTILEKVIGSRLTSGSRDEERRRQEKPKRVRKQTTEHQQHVRCKRGPALPYIRT